MRYASTVSFIFLGHLSCGLPMGMLPCLALALFPPSCFFLTTRDTRLVGKSINFLWWSP